MLEKLKQIKNLDSNKKWALIIGTGLALFPIHNKWLTDITAIEGQATLFLPALGAVAWILGTLIFTMNYWKELNWGDKKILVPLAIIAGSIGISGFTHGVTIGEKLAPLGLGTTCLFSYTVARKIGKDIFIALIPLVILGTSISTILGVINPGAPGDVNAGLITNYCASAGFLIFGAVVNQGKRQWILALVVLIGVFFIGTLEALFIIGVLGIAVLARRDLSRRFWITFGTVLGLATLWLALGYLIPLYSGNNNIKALTDVITQQTPLNPESIREITTGRWEIIIASLRDIQVLGHGFSLSTTGGVVHNTPLIIMHQVGVPAGLAWLFVSVYCLIKTPYKYAWAAILAMSVFDHYLWTQFGALWWCLVGISTTTHQTNKDYIFRRD